MATPVLADLLHELPANRRVLLVLDEAQVLARREHTDVAHSLRANLDSRKQSIKVMFAGSHSRRLKRTPEFLRRYLNRYLVYASEGSAADPARRADSTGARRVQFSG